MHPLIAIVGATAVGKTAFSLDLARALDGEIVSADSRLVYRGMNIGTAKPTLAEQHQAPHHLIDLINPDQDFSLALYQTLAYQTIDAIHQRNKIPLLVGGTGQYLAAVLEGWSIPQVAPDLAFRKEMQNQAEQQGVAVLYQQLQSVDPSAAQAIDANNLRRIIRALEVFHVTGTPISTLQQRHAPPYQIITFDLERPRAELYARIDARVDQMITEGLIDEVFGLIRQGYAWDLPAMSSLGYIEFRPLWEQTATAEACIQQLKFNTHRFARKQGAWFRRLPHRYVLDAKSPDLLAQSLQFLQADSPEKRGIDH